MRRKISGLLAVIMAFSIVLSSCDRDVETSSADSSSGSGKVDPASYNSMVVAEDFNEVNPVRLGGGGYVSGFVVHPKDPNIRYIRTDVGGAYRWDADKEEWIPITDQMTHSSYTYIDGIAIDPNNVDVVYICAGNGYPSDVFKSTDRGETWERTKISTQFKGNQGNKGVRECIQVDPNNSDVVICGTRDAGLKVSLDGCESWQNVKVLPDKQECEIRSVVIDKTSLRNGRSQVIYVSVTGVGVFKTSNAGESWALLENSPTEGGHNLAISNNGKLVVGCSEGVYVLTGNTLVNKKDNFVATSNGGDYDKFFAIAIDPNNSNRIAVSTTSTQKSGTSSPHKLPIMYSEDGGETWRQIFPQGNKNLTVPWWPAVHYGSAIASLTFVGTKQLYFTDWYGTWGCDDVTRTDGEHTWTSYIWGHEEMVTFAAMTTPSETMQLYITQADNPTMFYRETLDEYPSKEDSGGHGQIPDYYVKDPKFIALAGGTDNSGKRGHVQYTPDEGANWNTCSGWDSSIVAHEVAICSESSSIFVAIGTNSVPYYSYNRGRTWNKSSGAPTGTVNSYWSRVRVLVSDRHKGNVFYLLARDGFYRSEDWGKTWNCVNEDVKIGGGMNAGNVLVMEGQVGKLWVDTGNGIFYSEDYGDTFVQIEGLRGEIALGKGKEEGKVALWYMGTIGTNEKAVYYSLDNGATFTKVTNPEVDSLVKAGQMFGDVKKFGRVFLGTGGRGWFYIDITLDDE